MDIVQVISNVGFPIAAFLLMYKLMKDETAANRATLESLRASIDKNTSVTDTLIEHFHKEVK